MTLKELREKRAELKKEIRRLADLGNQEGRAWSAEDQSAWDKVNADFDSVGAQITRLERAEELERERAEATERTEREDHDARRRGAATSGDRDLAFRAWAMVQYDQDPTEQMLEACQRVGVNPRAREFEIALRSDTDRARAEYRAQSTTATEGGDTIPVGFLPRFEIALLAFGSVRRNAEIIRTASGNALPIPTTDDTMNKGAILAENTQVGEQDVVTGELVLNAYKYTSKLVRVSAELLQDSAFDFAGFLGARLGERIARITEEHFTTGTGTAQPRGIVTAATVGKTTTSATAITADEILDLIHSVDPAYRQGARFLMHDQVLKALRKLKATDGQYIWNGPREGEAQTIWGYPIDVSLEMASALATTNKTILFGALGKYLVRDVASIRLRRLVERYADFDQEGFVAFTRHDADLLDAGTNPVKVLQMA